MRAGCKLDPPVGTPLRGRRGCVISLRIWMTALMHVCTCVHDCVCSLNIRFITVMCATRALPAQLDASQPAYLLQAACSVHVSGARACQTACASLGLARGASGGQLVLSSRWPHLACAPGSTRSEARAGALATPCGRAWQGQARLAAARLCLCGCLAQPTHLS